MKVEFYKFYSNINSSIIYRYVNLQSEKTITGELYLPVPISRSEFEINSTTNDLTITAPISIDIVSDIISGLNQNDYWLEIKNIDEIIIFIGKVLNTEIDVDNNIATIKLSSISNILKTNIPFKSFSRRCTNSLFDKSCKLVKNNYDFTPVTFSKISNYKISIGTEKENGYFNYGTAIINGKYIQIHNHVDGYINLLYPIFDTEINTIVLYPGCDKTVNSCKDKFNNIINFGGFPDVPILNPAIKF